MVNPRLTTRHCRRLSAPTCGQSRHPVYNNAKVSVTNPCTHTKTRDPLEIIHLFRIAKTVERCSGKGRTNPPRLHPNSKHGSRLLCSRTLRLGSHWVRHAFVASQCKSTGSISLGMQPEYRPATRDAPNANPASNTLGVNKQAKSPFSTCVFLIRLFALVVYPSC